MTIDTKSNENYEEYKLIYYYPATFEKQKVQLNTKLETKLCTEETISKDNSVEVDIEKTNNTISVKDSINSEIYKGYLYTKSEQNTKYNEEIQIEIPTLQDIDTIRINQMKDNFLNEKGDKSSINNATYINQITFNKNELINVLGQDFNITVQENGAEIAKIDNNTEETEGKIVISFEEKNLEGIEIIASKPTQIGTFNINIEKYIKGETGYSQEQLKTFTNLENEKTLISGDKQLQIENIKELKDTTTEARLDLNTTKFSTANTNTNVQLTAILKSDSNKYDLYKNPYIEIKLPEELKQIKIHSINKVYGDEFKFTRSSFVPETKTIILQLEGEQKEFKTATEEGTQIVIDADLTFIKNTPSKEISINMLYKNENGTEEQYETSTKATLTTKYGAVLYNNISGYNEEAPSLETINEQKIEATLDLQEPEKQATVSQSFINNYNSEISQITMIGNLTGENAKIQNISAKQGNVKIYYSEKEDATEEDPSWQENIENAKSYKIEQQEPLAPAQKIDIEYQLTIPANLNSGEKILEETKIGYNYQNQALKVASNMELTAKIAQVEETQGIKTEITATSANKEITNGEEIFEGQPIKYTVKATNNTGKDLTNFQLVAEHTNAVYYITKETEGEVTDYPENPEMVKYTRKDENAQNVTMSQETFKKGETLVFTYEFAPKKKNGDEITGKIKMQANELPEQEIQTITNTIKDAKISIENLNDTDENMKLVEGNMVTYQFNITNHTETQQKDVIIKINTSDNLIVATPNYEQFAGQDVSQYVGQEMENKKLRFVEMFENYIIFKIPTIEAKETIQFDWFFFCQQTEDDEETEEYNKILNNISIYSTAELDNITYYSNTVEREFTRETARLHGEQSVSIEKAQPSETGTSETISEGDKLTYTAQITNNDAKLSANVILNHTVTEGVARILEAHTNLPSGEKEAKYIDTNYAYTSFTIQPGETVTYTAQVEAWENPDQDINYSTTLKSEMNLEWPIYGYFDLNTISLAMDDSDIGSEEEPKVEGTTPDNPGQEEDNPGTTPGTPGNPGNNDDDDQEGGGNNTTGGKSSIEGKAFLDADRDGVKADREEGLSNIKVNLVDIQTGSTVKTTQTYSEGKYKFSDIEEGTYIVTFEYNTALYNVTQYHKDGVSDDENSDVISKTLNGNVVAATDNIAIRNINIENIDAGFIENQKFDFSINKTINKVIVKNSAGTREINYNKTKLAKVDIHAKQLENSIVTVQYNFEVKNEGEIEGQINDIIDYMPNDLEFTKEENQDWTIGEDGNLHNISLAGTVIKPGETKEITLVLTKKMTENNTGTSANIAEIASATNEASISDYDSTPGNRKDGEDDISTAEVLVSIGTGMEVYITIGIILISLIITATSGTIYWKRKEEKHEK